MAIEILLKPGAKFRGFTELEVKDVIAYDSHQLVYEIVDTEGKSRFVRRMMKGALHEVEYDPKKGCEARPNGYG